MRKTNSLVFFLNPSKKRKKVPALSKSLHARALSHGEREEARGEKTVEIYRVPLLARVRVLFIRVSSFFFRACVRFVCARLVLRTFFFPVSKTRDIFRFSFCFLGETAQKGEMPNEKEGTKCGKKEGVFFVFWRERFVCCFAQKHTDMNHHVLCKGGGRGVQLAFAAFYFVQRR